MANPVIINPTLTLAGQAAAFNASNDGLELKITHVSFGTAHYDPTGNEIALVAPVGNKVAVAGASRPTPYQIRMVSSWREDVGQVAIGEIAFWAGETLVFVWSKADGTLASYKTDGVSYVLFNDLAFSSVPANSISFVIDPNESVALAALAAHEGAYNAHPQYTLRAKFPDYQGHLWGDVSGTANAITLTLPAIVELTQYIKGNRFSFKAVATNTGNTTISVGGVAAVQVLKTGGLPLTAGSIVAGGVYDVYYDGEKFQLTAGAGFASAEATQVEVTGTTAVDSTSWVSVRRLLQAMALKANLAGPTFTGQVSVPDVAAGNNSQLVANTKFVMAAISALVDSSPATLNTLKKLALALGSDPNFAATITTALGLKAPLASPVFTGDPQAPTPPQFDNDTSLATTEFVKQSGITLSKFNVYSATDKLLNSVAGGVVEFYGTTAGQTLTLPRLDSVRVGDVITIINYATVPVTIARQAVDKINAGSGVSVVSVVMQPGDSLVLAADSGWFVIGGSAANQFSGSFGSLLTGNGYQKLPSGLIIQWGYQSVAPSTTTSYTFPMIFPNACLSIVASFGTPAQGSVNADLVNSNQYRLQNLYTGGAQTARWIAVGY